MLCDVARCLVGVRVQVNVNVEGSVHNVITIRDNVPPVVHELSGIGTIDLEIGTVLGGNGSQLFGIGSVAPGFSCTAVSEASCVASGSDTGTNGFNIRCVDNLYVQRGSDAQCFRRRGRRRRGQSAVPRGNPHPPREPRASP